jgi:glutathione-specific gamma-glutamylcyclotransferase
MTTLNETMGLLPADHDRTGLWVFAYGSLMWRPDFDHDEVRDGLMRGYHRGLCLYSHQYRGTPDVPGLVFGLDRGGSCRGRALHVTPDQVTSVTTYLYEREMINRVYLPRMATVATPEGDIKALAFIADRDHHQYAGALEDGEAVRLIRQGVGHGGACIDYLENTAQHLRDLNIYDSQLERLLALAIK